MPTKTRQRWALPTLRIFQKSNISPIFRISVNIKKSIIDIMLYT